MIVFTICSRNFTAYAKTLFNSLILHHPDAEFYMFLGDIVDESYDTKSLPFKIIPFSELDIPDLAGMSQRYNITEFNTSIKPFAFLYLFNKLKKDFVLYFDPDILITSPMSEILDAISNGTNCLMTPHFLEPEEHFEISDQTVLLHGIYNLGFIGLRNNASVIKVVEWWSRRMVNECIIDLERGLFVDQKWADLFPAFIYNLTILHHPGYNVAYWNISNRKVKLVDGKWYSNDLPLRFFHFSGNKLEDPNILSRHTPSYNRQNIGDVKLLLDIYREQVFANGYETYIKQRYSFKWGGEKGINKHAPEPLQKLDENVTVKQESAPEEESNVQPTLKEMFSTAWTHHGGFFNIFIRLINIIKSSGIQGIVKGIQDTKEVSRKKKRSK
ncbi:MAG: hypothetical protein WCO02_08395 [Bacteroidota bacterium]